MFSDHDNPTAAAAAPAPQAESSTENPTAVPGEAPKTVEPAATETPVQASQAAPEATPAPAAKAEAAPTSKADKADASSSDETTASEEEAGSEEMSKLMQQYDEQHEAAAQNELVEVKVVAYTEQGVVVDLGGKTEGLIPAAEFSDAEVPRPE